MKYIQLEITFTKKREAVSLAKLLLANKLTADGQVSTIRSVFHWEGKDYCRKEYLLTAKTKENLYKECEEFIKVNHSFKVPQVVGTELKHGSQEYFGWIEKNTK